MYDEQTLRDWAYDVDREFIDDDDQDEDLTLGLVPAAISLPIIDDPSCPKGDYLLQCLDHRCMALVRGGRAHDLAEVREAADLAKEGKSDKVVAWAALQFRRLEYHGQRPVDKTEAEVMAQDLLNGISRNGVITVRSDLNGDWLAEWCSSPEHPYREWLRISQSNGRWLFSRSSDPKR